MPQLSVKTPLDDLTLTEEDGLIVSVDWGRGAEQQETPLLKKAAKQLTEYFDGRREVFDLPLGPRGTDFQHRVWAGLCDIPYGKTLSYGAMASKLQSSARAVGGACGRNPIPVLIPCHRVLATGGALTGYSGGDGIDTKRALLILEGVRLA